MESEKNVSVHPAETREGAAWMRNVEHATLWRVVGSVEGLSTLDLGCGAGGFTRQMLERGAASVTGVDMSAKMLEQAEGKEKEAPSKAKFVQSDIAGYTHPSQVDFALVHKVLHFAKDRDALHAMAEAIYRNLRDGGRFVGAVATLYPDGRPLTMPMSALEFEYASKERPLPDGVEVNVKILSMGFEVKTWYWYDETIASILKDVGFSKVEFTPLEIHGDEQWDERAKVECALPDCALRVLSATK